jgi:hypothetical protein
VFQGTQELSKIYQDSKLVYGKNTYNPYTIEFEIDSSSGMFIVPFSQYQTNNRQYTYNIYVNDVLYGVSPPTFSDHNRGTGYQLNGLTGSTAVIKLTPVNEDGNVVGWGRTFGFYHNNNGANEHANRQKILRVLNDPDYAHLLSETNTGADFRYYQYYNCRNLTQTVDESMPDTVTTIGNGFRNNQYSSCISLKQVPAEVLPSSGVTSIGDIFRYYQYNSCTGLTGSAPAEVLPSGVTTIGVSFRYQQYGYCTGLLTAAPIEVMPNTVTMVGQHFRESQYYNCTNLTTPAIETISTGLTFIDYNFKYSQYYNCPNIRISGYTHSYQFRNIITMSHWDDNSGQSISNDNYYQMFYLMSPDVTVDDVPKYYLDNTNTTTTPITSFSPNYRMSYLFGRTGIPNYSSINVNWR